jgi:hypothetical protein
MGGAVVSGVIGNDGIGQQVVPVEATFDRELRTADQSILSVQEQQLAELKAIKTLLMILTQNFS